jgi:pimeloyl-ACP methyl ester carboxylesterase
MVVYAVVVWIASSMFMHVRGFKPRKEPPTPGLTELTAVTEDGLTLRGSFQEPPDARGVVVLFHGIGCERYRATLPKIAAWGFVAASFDFRCHGTSDGEVTTFGWHERLDVAAIVGAVRSRWPGLKIALWGISLGGAALCYAADIARDADAVVLESVYRDIDSAFERRIASYAPDWAVPVAIPAKWLASARLGIEPAELRPAVFTAFLRADRTLIVTGGADPWAGPDDMRALAAPLPGCRTHVVPGANHYDVWPVGGEPYVAVVRAFIQEWLR